MNTAAKKKRYWNEPELGLWERVYVIEIVRGLWITSSVFFANLWKWMTGRKGALTTYYPEERRSDYSPNNRGRHVLTLRANGEVQCVSCNMCATVCPAYCIEIASEANFADSVHPKAPKAFEIDYSRCIFCGFCVEACPEDAIRMVQDTPDFPHADRGQIRGKLDLLKSWRPTSDPRKVYPAARADGSVGLKPDLQGSRRSGFSPTPPSTHAAEPTAAEPEARP